MRQRSQMGQLNPGVCEKMSERSIREQMPEEVAKHEADPYHHRYPRAEVSFLFLGNNVTLFSTHFGYISANYITLVKSYHDLAVRLEPIILELEREQNDLLIIAHESVLRVLYGYLMACNACEIPMLKFPRNEILEIIPASYSNEATMIEIKDCRQELIPDSPEDIYIPVPSSLPNSGKITPMGLTSGGAGAGTPRTRGGSPVRGVR